VDPQILGYWLDGYDKEKNVVIEADEIHHFDIDGNLREKDIIRQKEIEAQLKCKFLRIII
jgi:very-short-patch-repair endonuclease